MRAITQSIVIASLLLVSSSASGQHAEDNIPPELLEAFRDVQNSTKENPELLEQLIETGRERARFCNTCHGPDGSAVRPNYPSLAAQNPLYLLDQIEQFATGNRQKEAMNVLAEQFSTEEKITLSLYYANMDLEPAEYDAELADRGEHPYSRYCTQCHGSDGLGSDGYARIAGQQPVYVANVLTEYRSGDSPRRQSEMFGIVRALSNRDIETVAHYVARMGENR